MPDQERGAQGDTPGAAQPDPDVTRTDLPALVRRPQQATAESDPEATHTDPLSVPAPSYSQQPATSQWYPQQPAAGQWYAQQPAQPQRPAVAPPAEPQRYSEQPPAPAEPPPPTYMPQTQESPAYAPQPRQPQPPAQPQWEARPYAAQQQEARAYAPQPQDVQPQTQEPPRAAPPQQLPHPMPLQHPAAGVRRDPGGLVGNQAHGDSLVRRVGQGVARVFQPAQEVQSAAQFGEWVQHPITTGRRIAITSIRGGAGKSTVAALLATVFGHYRQDRVLALDVDPGLGSLALRLGLTPAHSLGDLAESTTQTRSFEEIQPFLTRAGEQLWVLPGTRGAVHDSTLDANTYQTAAAPLSRFFAVTVVDCGAGLLAELPRTVLGGAHAQVLVTHATLDGAVSAREALDWMVTGGFAELVPRTVVVFVARNPDAEAILDMNRATALVRDRGAGVVRLGYDRHVALGTTLDARRMAYATRLTAVRMAAESLRRALTV